MMGEVAKNSMGTLVHEGRNLELSRGRARRKMGVKSGTAQHLVH